MPPLIKIERLSLFLPYDASRRLILRDLDFELRPGARVFLTGPNGSGKSTFLRLLAGQLWPAAGKIAWNGESSPIAGRKISRLVSWREEELIRASSWVSTGADLLRGASEDAPMSYGDCGKLDENALILLDRLGSLELAALEISAMSHGQLRALLLARAFLAKPALLLLDEAFEGLDASRRNFFLKEIEQTRCAVAFASHRDDVPEAWPERRLRMRDGRLEPAPFARPCKAHNVTDERTAIGSSRGISRIEAFGASVFVNRRLVLKNINWRMAFGENWRICGLNGSGKSTFLRMLTGDEFVAAGGSLRVFSATLGRDCVTLEEKRKAISLVSDLTQALYGYPLNGLECVLSGIDGAIGLYRKYAPREIERAREMLGRFFDAKEADDIAKKSIRQMSSGQARRVFLARAMVNDPEIILLDEPCAGLDECARLAFLATLDKLCGQNGPGLVYVSHYGEDCPACINRHAEIANGELRVLA